MKASHRFVCNRECEYFPCHKAEWIVERPQDFNCLFCFCPLYFLEDCGGRPGWRGKLKDCTACDLPHRPEGYDHILARLRREFAERAPASSR